MYDKKIKTFYRSEMAVTGKVGASRSPEKPRLLMEYLDMKGLIKDCFEIEDRFEPFERNYFYLTHTKRYVDSFFSGKKPLCESNGLKWSAELAESVRYTNASLYSAIESAVTDSEQITFSPSAGFHHSTSQSGRGFCTFSGQVIASVKIFRERGLSGCYLDLDGHYGNSIEDSRDFVPELNQAVPVGFNFNPVGTGPEYVESLKSFLLTLDNAVLAGKIDYIVWCHGADSHCDDDYAGQCTTLEWIECSRLFYAWVKRINLKLEKPMPITICLFGGYRQDDYNSVLSLHTTDLVVCLNTLCCRNINYVPEVKPR